ncbi:hypothetical protein Acsp02_78450 [Actinoplanes sp. NBRC 103695]|nr:hypothetical protein Acsp02_78450 [Actinoplanes sp. NBRC 103695]
MRECQQDSGVCAGQIRENGQIPPSWWSGKEPSGTPKASKPKVPLVEPTGRGLRVSMARRKRKGTKNPARRPKRRLSVQEVCLVGGTLVSLVGTVSAIVKDVMIG